MSRGKIILRAALACALLYALTRFPPGRYPAAEDAVEYRTLRYPRRQVYFVQLCAFGTEAEARAFAGERGEYVCVLPGAVCRCLSCWYGDREEAQAEADRLAAEYPGACVYEMSRPERSETRLCDRARMARELARDQAVWDAACAANRARALLLAGGDAGEARRLCLSALAACSLAGEELPVPGDGGDALYAVSAAAAEWMMRALNP